jgi:hypothetical protein
MCFVTYHGERTEIDVECELFLAERRRLSVYHTGTRRHPFTLRHRADIIACFYREQNVTLPCIRHIRESHTHIGDALFAGQRFSQLVLGASERSAQGRASGDNEKMQDVAPRMSSNGGPFLMGCAADAYYMLDAGTEAASTELK